VNANHHFKWTFSINTLGVYGGRRGGRIWNPIAFGSQMLNFDKEVVPTIGPIGIDVNMVQCLQQKVIICSKEYEAMNGARRHP
jgi:hypothetical protein